MSSCSNHIAGSKVGFAGFVQRSNAYSRTVFPQPVPCATLAIFDDYQRFVDEQRQLIENFIDLQVTVGPSSRCGQFERTREDHLAGETRSARSRSTTYCDQSIDGAECLLAAHCAARTTHQQSESIVYTLGDIDRRQRPHLRSNKFGGREYAI